MYHYPKLPRRPQRASASHLALADTISDRIISLLDRVEQTTDFQLPPFSLALDLPEPGPGPDIPLAFEQPTLTYNEEELVQLTRENKTEHAQEILRQANKTPEDLKSNPAFQDILEHSERLPQQSRRLGGGFAGSKSVSKSQPMLTSVIGQVSFSGKRVRPQSK